MKYEWNTTKAESNLKKHGADFADAVLVFNDPRAITLEDKDHHEERFVALGRDAHEQLLVVIYVYRGDHTIRIISARQATKGEYRYYYED